MKSKEIVLLGVGLGVVGLLGTLGYMKWKTGDFLGRKQASEKNSPTEPEEKKVAKLENKIEQEIKDTKNTDELDKELDEDLDEELDEDLDDDLEEI